MPTYAYSCTECGHRFDIVQSFSDDALTSCPECGGRLRKVFDSVGVVFKGPGFYRTDSRATNGSSTSTGEAASDGATTGSATGASESATKGASASSGSTDAGGSGSKSTPAAANA